MLSIAIYSIQDNDIQDLKDMIQNYLADHQIGGRLQVFNEMKDLLTAPARFDIYLMDLDKNKEETLVLGLEMKKIDPFGHFVYIDSNQESFCDSLLADADYFLSKPITPNKFYPVLNKIRKLIKEETIVISAPEGDRKIRINNLNYIDIQNRCLCYHLKNGSLYDGRSMRTSFERSITPLQNNPILLFLPPSLLINVEQIDILNSDYLIFEDGTKLYFSKRHHDVIETRWHRHNNFSNSKILNK